MMFSARKICMCVIQFRAKDIISSQKCPLRPVFSWRAAEGQLEGSWRAAGGQLECNWRAAEGQLKGS